MKTVSVILRVRPIHSGKRITFRIHKFKVEIKLLWQAPWFRYKSFIGLHYGGARGGFGGGLRIWKAEIGFLLQWMYWSRTPGQRDHKDKLQSLKHKCPICDYGHYPRKEIEL